MNKLMLQVQLLLAALSALLPLVPLEHRGRVAEILETAAKALAFTGVLGAGAEDIAEKLAAVRANVEAMAAAGRAVTDDELAAAMTRVRSASADLRAALAAAG
ncbi:hypothetical protein [Terricaulis sp.]|uniref:hypothetical protein n=1 Tax=Terricaulis sp. TaxID=2768686 RepID=UPI002AC4AB03|nr:hypothetical protein [Terricaulis sp.]MDZ4693453.1 hypothetical protein [Terricaulis sp.]